jgi:predicted RNA-binding protein with PUA-like domain
VRYWLMKTEPETFSIDDLVRLGREPWTGVRSHFAKMHMRAMTVGDPVLFYHSSTEPPGVAGLARVSQTGVVDETQFDPASQYYDPKAKRETPSWDCVEVELVEKLPRYVPLPEIRARPELADMLLLRRGMRLSVQPVEQAEYERIVAMSREPAPVLPEPPPKPRKPPAKKKPAQRKPAKKPAAKAKSNAKPKSKPRKKR